MRKLIVEEWISLDGYAADANGQLDFFTSLSPEQNKHSDMDQLKFLEEIDTILFGRITYQLFVDYWPTAASEAEIIADKLNSLSKIVFSNTLTDAPWGNWPAASITGGDAVKAIKELKQLPGKNMIMWGSVSLVQSLIKENLVDEIHLQLCPVMTGGGRKLFPGETGINQLQLQEVKQYDTGLVFLNYTTGI
jgi:dihydrofolate reductase